MVANIYIDDFEDSRISEMPFFIPGFHVFCKQSAVREFKVVGNKERGSEF